MTPRAEPQQQVGDSIPKLSGSFATPNRRVIRGRAKSQEDKQIFEKDAGYIDRAAQRRSGVAITESETDINLDVEKVLEIPQKKPDTQTTITFRSREIELLCQRQGWDPRGNSSLKHNVCEQFTPGKMSFIYNLAVNDTPRTVMNSVTASTDTDFKISDEILKAVVDAFTPKTAPPPIHTVESMDQTFDLEDDMFVDAGIASKDIIKRDIQSQRTLTSEANTNITLPASINVILDKFEVAPISLQRHLFGEEEEDKQSSRRDVKDDYDECYPDTFQNTLDDDGSDEEEDTMKDSSSTKRITKRNLASKEKQKLDSQLRKVTKIMDKKFNSNNKED